jgi:hypothetical protein
MTAGADRDLLVGLLALQNGLIDQGALVAAFQACSLDKAWALADHLLALGHLNEAQRAIAEAMMDLHVAKHGDLRRSLAAIPSRQRVTRADTRRVALSADSIGLVVASIRRSATESSPRIADNSSS